MQRKIKISSIQFSFLVMVLLISDFPITNATTNVKQDSWISFIIGMLMGLILITMYLFIAKMHPEKNFIEILLDCFGKYLGTLVCILYIWFFMHLPSLTLRTFAEYMGIVNYHRTPSFFIMICLILSIIYSLRKGIEGIAREMELFIPILIISVIVLFLTLFKTFNFDFLRPILENGIKPVLKNGFIVGTTPFGELVVLLMIFPYLNKKENMFKATYLSVIIAGLLLLSVVVRELLVLGPHLLSFVVFTPNISTALLPTTLLEPFISINLLVGVAGSLCIYIHATTTAMAQLFKIEDHKVLIFPVSIIIVGISIWQFDNVSEMFQVLFGVFSYYAFFFQAIIPFMVLVISFIKRKSISNKS